MSLKAKPFLTAYDNNIEAFIPEQWANESIAILIENMVAANLVHRDFEPVFAKRGDTVNTRKPAMFQAKRKGRNEDVTIQNADATNVPVVLDQHIHVSFLLRDGEETLAFKDLVTTYLEPAAKALARDVDRVVLGQYVHFLENQAGSLGGLTNANVVEYITETGKVMDDNLAHEEDRNLILSSLARMKAIQNATFHQADRVGDEGTALREASIGRKLNFNTFMSQNMRSMATDTTLAEGAINNAAGYPVGTTVITVDAFAMGELVVADAGRWASINGKAYHITAVNADPATSLTLEYGLVAAVADNDVVKVFDKGAVNNGAGYAAGYSGAIVVDGFTGSPINVGQLVTFGTSNVRYTVKYTDGSTSIELDRPLEAALTDNLGVNLGPANGDYNFAFHRNALTLAIRPLALPRAGAGAVSGLANYNGLTMRTVITYDGTKQGHLVTLDFLAGVKVLDTDLGAVMLS
jgi:coat protein Gp5